jgi:putative PIN family toxin of toxin-antitoxin system
LRIVVDTNVLVSGILSPHGPPATVLRLLLNEHVSLCFDERIMSEYRDVLTRGKFGFDSDLVEDVLSFLEVTGVPVVANPLSINLPDPADLMLLEVSHSGSAEFLVTGNLGHFPKSSRGDIVVLSPRNFVDHIGSI